MNKNQHKTMTTNDIYFVFAYIHILTTCQKKYQVYINMRTFYSANKCVQILIRKGVKKSNTKIYKKKYIYVYVYCIF